jgi:hypothetical protein
MRSAPNAGSRIARRVAALGVAAVLAGAASASCVGTTGGALVTFPAAAAGIAGADANGALEFTSDEGWDVVLTKATLHVGAVYLDQSQPVSGSQGTTCILPGTYVGQVTPTLSAAAGLDVDLLSPTPQPFSVHGQGTTLPEALVGQLWLTGGDVNTVVDNTPILALAGTATNASGTAIPFSATITIGSNRSTTDPQGAAGGDPICKERIVSVPASLYVETSGGLLVTVDPRQLFLNVNFSQLTMGPNGTYAFSDDPTSSDYTAPSRNLYQNLHSAGSLYTFSWSSSL